MKNQENKVVSLKVRVMAGILAGLMFATAILGVVYYLVQ